MFEPRVAALVDGRLMLEATAVTTAQAVTCIFFYLFLVT